MNPLVGWTMRPKPRLIELLKGLAQAGKVVIVVTHDVELATVLADRVVLMSQGEVIATGSPAEVLSSSPFLSPQVARLFPGTTWCTVEEVLAQYIRAAPQTTQSGLTQRRQHHSW